MAAIDKLYAKNYEEYREFKEWCEEQPWLTDKYGRKEPITAYLYQSKEPWTGERVLFMAPCYVDAYLIRNCPLEFIQEELKVRYGGCNPNFPGATAYDKIKAGELYESPKVEGVMRGKHSRLLQSPPLRYNRPFGGGGYWVDLDIPEGLGMMRYNEEIGTWDFCEEYVIGDWISSTATVRTIQALKRKIRRWNLPIGTIVRASGAYVGDDYAFQVTE